MGLTRKSSRQSKTSRALTYKEALSSLRSSAEAGVQDGIDAARMSFVSARPRSTSRRGARGMELEALYSGILNAVAVSILETAHPGREIDLARLVADQLVAKVEALGCVGNA